MLNRKRLIITFVLFDILAVAAYIGIGLFMHNSLTDISDGCKNRSNRPSSFETDYFDPVPVDFDAYAMETYEMVTFPSREVEFNLSAWYIPGEPGSPAVISVHGIGSCKYSAGNLTQAGMLNNAGLLRTRHRRTGCRGFRL